ncbi:hypothetical protein T190115A13A_80044 [Tenacibaculum sp. 190524A02b]|uniref:Peptidase M10 metallopeptidase domain-containing protein n=1 Tax=Tenacibaculum vairaonense TaxID=3137860 RepID=A0ABP1FFM2_9FLAO
MRKYKPLFITMATALLVMSCQNEETLEQNQYVTSQYEVSLSNPIVQQLLKKGWEYSQIKQISEDFYLVGDDFLYPTKESTSKVTVLNRQSRSDELMDIKNAKSVNVYVDKSLNVTPFPNEFWEDAIFKAVKEWNKVPNTSLRFKQVFNSKAADVVVLSDRGTLPKDAFAAALAPQSGRAGKHILVNTKYTNSTGKPVNESQRVYNMVHELGHAIGLKHTNWKELREPAAIHIQGTASVDSKSVMNGGTPELEWKGFSEYDMKAVQILYPE